MCIRDRLRDADQRRPDALHRPRGRAGPGRRAGAEQQPPAGAGPVSYTHLDVYKRQAYACLAETALLAMEGRFEDYTLGRNISMERVKEIYRLFKKHDFRIAGLRSHDEFVTEEMVAEKRALADRLRAEVHRVDGTGFLAAQDNPQPQACLLYTSRCV